MPDVCQICADDGVTTDATTTLFFVDDGEETTVPACDDCADHTYLEIPMDWEAYGD